MTRWLRSLAGQLGEWLSRLSGEEPRARLRDGVLTVEAHPLVTEIRLKLDRPEPRTLRFTMAEASAFLKQTGISVWTGKGTPDGQGLDILALEVDQLVHLLAVCCFADDPTVTPEQLAPHLVGENLLDVIGAVAKVVGDFHPPISEDVLKNPLVASALIRWMSSSTGRSQLRHSGLAKPTTGGSRRG